MFIIFSVMYLTLIKMISFTPKFHIISRFEDDLLLIKKAYDECKEGKGQKIGPYSIITLEQEPPQTKTKIKRKFILDENCELRILVY